MGGGQQGGRRPRQLIIGMIAYLERSVNIAIFILDETIFILEEIGFYFGCHSPGRI